MADNRRTKIKAAIRRATDAAQQQTTALDKQALDDLTAIYQLARRDIEADIRNAAGDGNNVKQDKLNALLTQVNARLQQLGEARNALLFASIRRSAELGAAVWGTLTNVADTAETAALKVRTFVAADGLQLSDRLWRLDNHARRVVAEAIQSAVIQGHGASQAAAELLAHAQAVPPELTAKEAAANADTIARQAGNALMTGEGDPYENALRVMRTEINRAHNLAYEESAFQFEDTIGTKFNLSPAHPRTDICDMHASVNLYGLGPGVYPKGKNPYPAHPNTISYVTAVFRDEVSDADRAGKQTRLDWLKGQEYAMQRAVLGAHKAGALHAGVLTEHQIATPWRILKGRYESRGIDTTAFGH